MQNRFGLKDAILLAGVIIAIVLAFLGMIQKDMLKKDIEVLRGNIAEQTRLVARLSARLETAGSAPAQPQARAPRDESWARPGVPVTWPKPYEMASDPTGRPDYAEGGTFTEIFEGKPPKITPFTYTDVYGQRVIDDGVCEMLATYDSNTLELRGMLAEAWQYDTGGMWLRVKIDDRAVFSDGKPVTAEDVRFTFHDFIFNSEIECERFRSTLSMVKKVVPISEKVVDFEFTDPRFNNLDEALRFVILPSHFYKQFTPQQINRSTGLLMGSGPWRLERLDPDDQWTQGEPIEMVRNEEYWGRRPALDRLRYISNDDNIARLTAYENGLGDMMRATPEQYRSKIEDPSFLEKHQALAWNNMRSGYALIAWNCGNRNGKPTPFVDRRVRRAMTMLLDRERINRDFYEGLATVCTGPFNPRAPQSDPDVKPLPYDLDECKRLLTEAGWIDRNADGVLENERGDRFSFEYFYSSGSTFAAKTGAYLRDQCAKVGIVCELQVRDWAIGESIRKARDYDAFAFAWSWTKPESDPVQLWHSRYIANQGDNFVQWNSPEADKLIDAGQKEIDPTKRMKIWHELHRLINEEQPCTFVLNTPWIRFVSKRVANVQPYATGFDKREMYIPASSSAP